MASTIATTARIGSAPSWASSLGGYYYAAGDAWYTVVQNTADAGIQVTKAAYAGTSFAEQDAARNLTAIDSNSPFDWFPSGNFLYVVYFSTATGLRVRRFNMSTDLWELTDIGNATFATADQAYPVRIAVRSDGDILVGYGPTTLAANLTRYEGSGWQTPVNMLSSAVITDLVMDADDTAWLIMVDTSAADLTVRSYSSTNVAGTVTDLDTAIDVLSARTNQSVVYNDGTADRIGCGARDSTDEYDFWHFTTTGTIPGSPGVVNAVSDTDFDLQPTTIASAVVGTTIVTVWPKVNLIKYNISDDLATPAFSLTASQAGGTFTDTDPCPLIMTDGTAWGVVYQDAGAVAIEWIVAPAGPVTHQLTGTSAGVGSSTATAEIVNDLDATSAGVGAASGNLDVITGGGITHQLTGTSAGVGDATGAVRLSNALGATSAGVGGMAASLGVTQQVTGTSPGISGATGAIAVTRSLSATSAGIGSATGAIAQTLQLSGTSSGVGGTSGTLVEAGVQQLTGISAGVGGQAGSAGIANRISGTSPGIGAASGSLRLTMALDGQSLGAGNMAGTLRLIREMLGISPGVGSESGAIGITLQLVGTSAGVGSGSASFEPQFPPPAFTFGAPGRVTVLVSHERSELGTAVRATRLAADPTIRSG